MQFGVPKSTVGVVWKDRDKIEAHVSASGNPVFAKKRCIVREPQFDKLNQGMLCMVSQQRSKGAPMSGPVLQEKPCSCFQASLYPDKDDGSFKASPGWFECNNACHPSLRQIGHVHCTQY